MSIVYIRFGARRSNIAERTPLLAERSPLLERLIARAAGSARVTDWRAEAFGVLATAAKSLPPIAPTALAAAAQIDAAARGRGAAWVCVATPVHFTAGMSSVTLPDDGILDLRSGEALALAADFNQVFDGSGTRLQVVRAAVDSAPGAAVAGGVIGGPATGGAALLLCTFERPLEVTTHDPERVAGHDVFAFQPGGADAPRLRRLMSEMEMWLFAHALNQARGAHAEQRINGLWLWGGGMTGRALPSVHGWTAGDDPFFAAFGCATQFPREGGAGVVVCAAEPGSNAWPEIEQRWLVPAVAALRLGRISRLDLSAADWRFSVRRAPNLRFLRRARPWWESFNVDH